MNASLIREKLHQIIDNASDEKLEEIYHMIDTPPAPHQNWWENKEVICEFDERVKEWVQDEQKGYSLLDIDQEIAKRKK